MTNALNALTFAVLAVALAPFAYWELGERRGRSEYGSPRWMRHAFVAAWLLCIVFSVSGMAFDAR